MKKISWNKVYPHLIAIAVFLIVALVYCKPALQGKVLQQLDITHWKGMAQDAFNYKEQHGHFPLWNTHLFSGMPNYQVAMDSKSFLPDINSILSLWMPKPVSFFFLACICFYILCMAFGTNTLVGILGGLAFAYSSYDPIIISVGHDTKMLAIAYMPALLAGLLLLYNRKYIIGLFVTALFATMEIGVNHPQINYYFIIIALILTIAYVIKWVRAAQYKHMLIALALALMGGLIGVANSAVALLTTAEYAKYTMRGGKTLDINDQGGVKEVKTTGLDEDYAFQYSLGKGEVVTLMMPHSFGESTGTAYDENSKVVSALTDKGVPENSAIQVASSLPKYWGGIVPSTAGPVYLGAIICILFLVGLVVVKGNDRWWILAASIFAIFMAWGQYFLGFNQLLFKYFPLYNKFRAPSMSLVIPQLLFPLLAALCLQKIFFTADGKQLLQRSFKPILYVVGGVFVLLLLMYLTMNYSGGLDTEIIKAYTDPKTGSDEFGRLIVNAMMQDRKGMFMADILRALVFAAVTLVAFFLYLKNIVKPVVLVIVLALINTADLLTLDSKYLNENNYADADTYEQDFTPTPAISQIMKDTTPHYRVYNLAQDRFSESLTAYYLRCIGGYHPAKLRIYQDIIENQLSKNNMQVLNMLDTKYFLIPSQQQQNQSSVQPNDSALGACWFVNEVKFVNGPAEEMKALDNFNAATTAIVDNSFKSFVKNDPSDASTDRIQLVSYDNDDIKYISSTSTDRFAVLSEVYYPAGWNAYIDGKKTDYCKVNYVLRGISVPAGKHEIEFKFEPLSYYTGQTIAYVGNILLWLSLIGALYVLWKRYKESPQELNE